MANINMTAAELNEVLTKNAELYDEYVNALKALRSDVYATSVSGYTTTTKIASTPSGDFALKVGARVVVRFANSNAVAAPTLNVDGTGAVPIMRQGTTADMAYKWQAGEVLMLVYDGTNYVVSDGGLATTGFYGVTRLASLIDASTTLAATPNAVKSYVDSAIAAAITTALNTGV